jgi:hypothetical protein
MSSFHVQNPRYVPETRKEGAWGCHGKRLHQDARLLRVSAEQEAFELGGDDLEKKIFFTKAKFYHFAIVVSMGRES